jgi:hypothetical protein
MNKKDDVKNFGYKQVVNTINNELTTHVNNALDQHYRLGQATYIAYILERCDDNMTVGDLKKSLEIIVNGDELLKVFVPICRKEFMVADIAKGVVN